MGRVSVPLSGLLFLNRVTKEEALDLPERFRPLIGVIISKPTTGIGNIGRGIGFRPLIGVIISKLVCDKKIEVGDAERVSVPLSGLLFLNSLFFLLREWMKCFRPLIGVIISKPSPLTSPIE